MSIPTMLRTIILTSAFIGVWFIQTVNAKPSSDREQENSNCDEATVAAVGKHLRMNSFSYRDTGGIIIIGVCKVWPTDKEITIVVFVSSGGAGHSDDLTIAMINNRNAKVVASYHEALVNSFTPRINVDTDKLRIDTAQYDLAPGVRAFGLDVIPGPNRKRYCGEDEIGTIRTLFVRDGETIRAIFLDGLPLSFRRFIQGDPECTNERSTASGPSAIVENIDIKIGIGKVFTNGYANLLITAVSSNSDRSQPKRKTLHHELRYDKNIYNNRDIGSYQMPYIEEALDQWRRE